uniref:DDT domain-containing protein n=1 Tax=Oryza nivara TaxID=4536 RepID=A0A0E0G5H4_ORYNI
MDLKRRDEGAEESFVKPLQLKVKDYPLLGVHVSECQIYDLENRMICYQTRRDFTMISSQHKRRPCENKYCREYLVNICNQSAEGVAQKVWNFSKCRGMCSYRLYRKKNWEMLAEILDHAVNTLGYTSVHKLLNKGSYVVAVAEMLTSTPLEIWDLRFAQALSSMEIVMAGKACHQCRQMKRNFAVACTQVKKKGVCPIKYCHRCLLKRYDENDEEVGQMEAWICPKCRGICNCSCCRRKKGQQPTGRLVHTAKKGEQGAADEESTGRSLRIENSVEELLVEGDQIKLKGNIVVNKNFDGESSLAKDKNGSILGYNSAVSSPNKKVLPRGSLVTNILGADLEVKDVGPAIQLYEFCNSFGEIFQIRKGQPEQILQDIERDQEVEIVPELIADFHKNLLSVIKEDRGEKNSIYITNGDAWLNDLGAYINELAFMSKELHLEFVNKGTLGYNKLSPCKLHVLNLLCDEALSTVKLRKLIEEQNGRAAERRNDAKAKLRAAKAKEKELREGLKNDMKEGATPIEGNRNQLISDIKKAKEVKLTAIKEKKLGTVLRSKPLMLEDREAYWKLDGYSNNKMLLLQEFDNENFTGNDIWFEFTEDEEKTIENHAAIRSMLI